MTFEHQIGAGWELPFALLFCASAPAPRSEGVAFAFTFACSELELAGVRRFVPRSTLSRMHCSLRAWLQKHGSTLGLQEASFIPARIMFRPSAVTNNLSSGTVILLALVCAVFCHPAFHLKSGWCFLRLAASARNCQRDPMLATPCHNQGNTLKFMVPNGKLLCMKAFLLGRRWF